MFHPTLDPQLVGEVIAARRKKKGVSQEVLSGLADIGRTHLSASERGERKPMARRYMRKGRMNAKWKAENRKQ